MTFLVATEKVASEFIITRGGVPPVWRYLIIGAENSGSSRWMTWVFVLNKIDKELTSRASIVEG